MQKTNYLAALAIAASLFSFSAHAVGVGEAAPSFTLPTLQGDKATALKSYAGKVVYVDFWASWCAPCKTSFPLLNDLHKKLKAKGFEVVAINMDEDKSKAEKFLEEHKVDFTVLRDAKGEWADKFVVESMPTSFLVDKKGNVTYIHKGFTSGDIAEIEAKVNALLK